MNPPGTPQLLSSVQGEITAILIVYPGFATAQGDAEYADIVAEFDRKGTVYRFRQEVPEFTLRVSALRLQGLGIDDVREVRDLQPATDIAAVLMSWGRELEGVREAGRLPFRRWAQDPFLVLQQGEWTILLDSLHNRRLCDFFLPLEVAQQAGPQFLVRPTRLYIEGGNVLRGINAVFMGMDLVQENMRLHKRSQQQVLDEFAALLGVGQVMPVGLAAPAPRLLVEGGIGDTWQPLFHIDLFMTPGGIDAASGKETIFLAKPSLAAHILRSPQGAQCQQPEAEPRAEGMFQEIATQLQQAGFRLVRLPIFFINGTTYTWNNCLVEVSGAHKRAYLPSYQCSHDPERLNASFQALEVAVQAIYEYEGFEVVWFRNGRFFRTLAGHGGSLHCAVKVMARRPD